MAYYSSSVVERSRARGIEVDDSCRVVNAGADAPVEREERTPDGPAVSRILERRRAQATRGGRTQLDARTNGILKAAIRTKRTG